MQPSFSGLLVTCAYLPQTTLPPGVTRPSSLTFTCSSRLQLTRTFLVCQSCKLEATAQTVEQSLCTWVAGFPACPSIASWSDALWSLRSAPQ